LTRKHWRGPPRQTQAPDTDPMPWRVSASPTWLMHTPRHENSFAYLDGELECARCWLSRICGTVWSEQRFQRLLRSYVWSAGAGSPARSVSTTVKDEICDQTELTHSFRVAYSLPTSSASVGSVWPQFQPSTPVSWSSKQMIRSAGERDAGTASLAEHASRIVVSPQISLAKYLN
jgi:hypothetical protein